MIPLVSVIIPFYNAEKYILQTLESVKNQSYKRIELLLYDDASIDNTSAIVKKWLNENYSHFHHTEFFEGKNNKGVGFGSNFLLNKISGLYFQKLDADDILISSKIFNQVQYLESNPNVSLVYSNVYRIDSFSFRLKQDYFTFQNFKYVNNFTSPSGYIFDKLLEENFIPASSILARYDKVQSIGGYDPTLFSEDWDLWLRLSKFFEIHFINECNCEYRIHSESAMQNELSRIKVFKSLNIALVKHLNGNKLHNKIISKHIYTYTIGMYRMGCIDLKWLRINVILNPGVKSIMYLIAGFFNIPIRFK